MRKKCTDSFAKKSLDKFRRMEFLRLEKEKINFFFGHEKTKNNYLLSIHNKHGEKEIEVEEKIVRVKA